MHHLPPLYRALFIPLITVLLTGCVIGEKIIEEEIIGNYVERDGYPLSHANLELREDGTFSYFWGTSLISGKTDGTWEVSGKRLLLTSDLKKPPEDVPGYSMIRMDTVPGEDSILIRIIDEDRNPIPYAIVNSWKRRQILGGTYQCNNNGEVRIPDRDAEYLMVSATPYYTIKYSVAHETANSLVFQMKPSPGFYHFFEEEKWKYRDRCFFPPVYPRQIRYSKKYFFEKRIR